MFKFKKSKTPDLNPNINQYQPVLYGSAVSRLKELHGARQPQWAKKALMVILTLAFSITDAVVLFSLMDTAFVEDPRVGMVSAFTCAVLLNLYPVMAVAFAKRHLYGTHRLSKKGCAALIIIFFILFTACVGLRIGNKDMFEPDGLENSTAVSVTVDAAEKEDKTASPKVVSGLVLLCILPLATSIANGTIAWFAIDPLEKEIQVLEHTILGLKQQKADIDAAKATMPGDKELQQMLASEADTYDHAKEIIEGQLYLMYVESVQVLEERVGTPAATSKLTEEGLKALL